MDVDLDGRVLIAVALLLLVLVVLWVVFRRPRARGVGANPNPAYITDEMWWLWQQLQALEPSSKLGGIYANKPGYHNARKNLPSWDYSVCDDPPDQWGPSDKAAAIDWTFPDAQAGDYKTISKYTKRLLLSAQDLDDPRLDGWREFFGNADDDSYVEGWDCRYYCASTSDPSHLWHLHISECRDQVANKANKEALLSVLKGETVEQWMGAPKEGDGAVLLNCPYDNERLDLLYVGPDGSVMHRWWTGGMDTAWSTNTKSESLGGSIHVGTLTAAWAPDGNSMNIAGLGAGDSKCPVGCGQYWGMNLGREGVRTGWGSFEAAYGKLPQPSPVVVNQTHEHDFRLVAALVIMVAIAVAVSLLAVIYALR